MRWIIINICLFVISVVQLNSAESTDQNPTPVVAASSSAYQFKPNSHHLYAYTLKQTVKFTSAGDELSYYTSMTWKFALSPVTVNEKQAQVAITILRIQATHDGPGSHRQIDSNLPIENDGHEDPLIGHLLAFAGAELLVTVDPTNGQVSSVTGGDAVVAQINKLVPPLFPGEPAPLDAAAQAAFSDAALTRMWNQMLALPSTEPQMVPLGPPLEGALQRQWQGEKWTDSLPDGTKQLQATILKDPTPVTALVKNVAGSGTRTVVDGLPGSTSGKLSFDLEFTALTQPVLQQHTVLWELTPLKIR